MCRDNWWKNILYVNNFDIPTDGPDVPGFPYCVGQAWYLASEMQMFLFTPFILLPTYWIYKKFGHLWGLAFQSIFLVLSTITVASISAIREWPINLEIR